MTKQIQEEILLVITSVDGSERAVIVSQDKDNRLIKLSAGEIYRFLRKIDSKWLPLEQVIGLRLEDDLKLQFTEDESIILQDYFTLCVNGECVVEMALETDAKGDLSYFSLSTDSVGLDLDDGSQLMLAHGDIVTLMQLTQGQSALSQAIEQAQTHQMTLGDVLAETDETDESEDEEAGVITNDSGSNFWGLAPFVAFGWIAVADLSSTNSKGAPAAEPAGLIVNAVSVDDVINAKEKAEGFFLTGIGEAGVIITISGFKDGVGNKVLTINPDGTWSIKINGTDLADNDVNTLVVTQTDDAGNEINEVTKVLTIDDVLPTVSITIDKEIIGVGQTATVTFSFSEAPIDFTVDDVAAGQGSISSLTASNDGTVYTAIFIPDDNATADENVISVSMDWTDTTGNAPLEATESLGYRIYAALPTVDLDTDDSSIDFNAGPQTVTQLNAGVDIANSTDQLVVTNLGAASGSYTRVTDLSSVPTFSADFTPAIGSIGGGAKAVEGVGTLVDFTKPIYTFNDGSNDWYVWSRIGSGYHVSQVSDITEWYFAVDAANSPADVTSWGKATVKAPTLGNPVPLANVSAGSTNGDAKFEIVESNDSIKTVEISVSGVQDAAAENLVLGNVDVPLNADATATATIDGVAVSYSYVADATGGVITITPQSGTFTVNQVSNIIAAISYRNNEAAATAGDRTFAVRIADGSDQFSEPATTTINVVALPVGLVITGVFDDTSGSEVAIAAGGTTIDRTLTVKGNAETNDGTIAIYVQVDGINVLVGKGLIEDDSSYSVDVMMPGSVFSGGPYNLEVVRIDSRGETSTAASQAVNLLPVVITEAEDDVGRVTGTLASGDTTDDQSPTLKITLAEALTENQVVAIYDGDERLGEATMDDGTHGIFEYNTEPVPVRLGHSDHNDVSDNSVRRVWWEDDAVSIWISGIKSIDKFAGDGKLSTTVAETNTQRVFGLNLTGLDPYDFAAVQEIDYGIKLRDNSTAVAIENGVELIHALRSYAENDIFSIERIGNQVNYFQNGTLFHSSSKEILSDDAWVDYSIATANGTVNNLTWTRYEGSHEFTAKVENTGGEVSLPSTQFNLTIQKISTLSDYTLNIDSTNPTIDLTQIAEPEQSPIDTINFDNTEGGAAAYKVTLNIDDVLQAGTDLFNAAGGWSGLESEGRSQIRVDGEAGTIEVEGSGWVQTSNTTTFDGNTYLVYNHGADAQLLIDDDLERLGAVL